MVAVILHYRQIGVSARWISFLLRALKIFHRSIFDKGKFCGKMSVLGGGKPPKIWWSASKEKEVGILQDSVSSRGFNCCEPNGWKQVSERVYAYWNRTVKTCGRTGKIIGFEEREMVFWAALFSVAKGYALSVRRSRGKGFLKQFILNTVLGTL